MATTFIFVSKNKSEADKRAGLWLGAGFAVTGIGPTDRVESLGDAAPKLVWESGGDADWHVVIGTRDQHKDWQKDANPAGT